MMHVLLKPLIWDRAGAIVSGTVRAAFSHAASADSLLAECRVDRVLELLKA